MEARLQDPKVKALEINLDKATYGSLAEIGAGQEVAAFLFKAGAASQTIQGGVFTYQAPSNSVSGFSLYNIACDGKTYGAGDQGGAGDMHALFDNGLAGSFLGIRPDLLICLFTNDVDQSTIQKYGNAINRLIDRVDYANILFLNPFDQSGRDLTQWRATLKNIALSGAQTSWVVTDGVTTTSSNVVTSASLNLSQSDVGHHITGTGIPASTYIKGVSSVTSLTLGNAAGTDVNITGTGQTGVTLTVFGSTPPTACVVLDLYEAWSASGQTGYTQANAAGLMYDTLHESQFGHTDITRRVLKVLEMY